MPELVEEALQRRPVVLERAPQDHVLHRVGRDDVRVVALGVGGEEALAEHLHADLAGEQPAVERAQRRLGDLRQAVQRRHADAVHRHLELAVADARAGHARTRSASRRRAIFAISDNAVCSSSSGSASSRRAAEAMIVSARVLARADDEREAEALAVRGGEPGDALVLRGRQPVEPRRRLLARRLRRQRAGDRGLAREVGMRADQRQAIRAAAPRPTTPTIAACSALDAAERARAPRPLRRSTAMLRRRRRSAPRTRRGPGDRLPRSR